MHAYFNLLKKSPFLMLAVLCFLLACGIQKEAGLVTNYTYSKDRPIEGQLHTAQRLKDLMDKKEYEKATQLFSKKQQANIKRYREQYPENFKFWYTAWRLDAPTYERYRKRIEQGKGRFIFEEGEWKINEK